jgi:hypothetical protein
MRTGAAAATALVVSLIIGILFAMMTPSEPPADFEVVSMSNSRVIAPAGSGGTSATRFEVRYYVGGELQIWEETVLNTVGGGSGRIPVAFPPQCYFSSRIGEPLPGACR